MAKLKSIRFPFQKGTSQFPSSATDDDAIRCSLIQLFSTSKNERVMRPSYGVQIQDYIFESDSEATQVGIEREIRSAVARWEPRVAISTILVEFDDGNEPGQVLVTIYYTVVQTGSTGSITIGV